jgi:hypothetical protein
LCNFKPIREEDNMNKLGLSVVTAALLATSATALDNIKVDGMAKIWYQTINDGAIADDGLFDGNSDAANESGNLVFALGVTGNKGNVGFGAKLYSLTTMGLENNTVEGVATSAGTENQGDPTWLAESYVTYTAGKTLVKIGRQELDTPLAFTEKWNAAPNTFEAAVVINQSIENLVLIGAYVGNGNGYDNGNALASNAKTVVSDFHSYYGGGANGNGTVAGDDKGGAYAAAAVFSGIKDTPIKAFYYSLPETADAYWADVHGKVAMVDYGVIVAGVTPSGATEEILDVLGDTSTTTAIAAKVSGNVAGVSLSGAFSVVSEGNIPVANTATNFKKTKLPTAGIFTDGMYVARPDTTAIKLTAGYKVADVDLVASYVTSTTGENDGYVVVGSGAAAYTEKGNVEDLTTNEFNIVAKTKLDAVNLAAMYIYQQDYKATRTENNGDVILDDRSIIRVIASVGF